MNILLLRYCLLWSNNISYRLNFFVYILGLVSVGALVDTQIISTYQTDPHDIVLIENEKYHPKNTYHLQDFFWTGSGDGAIDPNEEYRPTVFVTATITSTHTTTVYETTSISNNDNVTINCLLSNCDGSTTSSYAGTINPTSTSEWENFTTTLDEMTTVGSSTPRYQVPERTYWIITILGSKVNNGKFEELPIIDELEARLAMLYQIAFYRQQQKHLGIHRQQIRSKRATIEPFINKTTPANVNVQIHNITKSIDANEVEILYSVRVANQLVPAKTAASDMRLVTDAEAIHELGYTLRTKAEPYLKEEVHPLGLARYQQTWVFITSGLAILFLLILLLLLITIAVRKRSKKNKAQTYTEDTQVSQIERVFHGQDNVNFRMEDAEVQTCEPTRPQPKPHHKIRVSSSESECSSPSATSSEELSPTLSHYQWKGKKRLTPRKEYSIVPQNLMVDQIDSYQDVVDATNMVALRKNSYNDIQSAHSYLSMPSVKNFPRSSIPEPLSRVLEPVSIRHLDDPESPRLHRHGSMQDAEDPGVIGPLVWNQHKQKLQQVTPEPNVGRMKKRFQELLDDAFSLFGSRSVTPEEVPNLSPLIIKRLDLRAQSAHPRLSSDLETPKVPPIQQRPKTSDPRRSHTFDTPKCAWGSDTPSLVRPLSAGAFHKPTLAPHICPISVLPESRVKAINPVVRSMAEDRTQNDLRFTRNRNP